MIRKIEAKKPVKRKKVAAYARVSMETERLNHSLAAQIDYYSNFIQSNPEWEYVDVFYDHGISGTSIKKRNGFQEMIAVAGEGGIDLILTKSIQRFARNTVDLLNTVRFLKSINVDVYFEKEHISTLSAEGELMLTLLASFAQEESRSISDNVKWALRKRMELGIVPRQELYGYTRKGDKLEVVPEEAEVVKRIYDNFRQGKSRYQTMNELNAEGITTRNGVKWRDFAIRYILTNITYTGNMLLQKKYSPDPLTGKRLNNGELPQYYVENTHEAIIEKAVFDEVQEKMKEIRDKYFETHIPLESDCFSRKIKCENCGSNFVRTTDRNNKRWICSKRKRGLNNCKCGTIRDDELFSATSSVLGLDKFDGAVFKAKIDHISIPVKGVLHFHFKDKRSVIWQK